MRPAALALRSLAASLLAVALAAAPAGAEGRQGSSQGGFGAALATVRAQAGLGRLREDPRLTAAAQARAQVMAATGQPSHVGPDGSTQITRAQAAGCRTRFVGENIAWGIPSAQAAFDGWMASPGHRANMLHPSYGAFGLGQADGMWVLMFADRC